MGSIPHFLGGVSLAPSSLACLGVTPPVNLLLSLPDGPSPLHLLPELCHHAEQIFHLLTPHTGAVPATLLDISKQAQALPAAGGRNSHILGQGLRLGRHGLCGASWLPGGDRGKPVASERQYLLPVGKLVSRARRDSTSAPSCTSCHTCCCSMLWLLRTCCLLLTASGGQRCIEALP